MDFMNSKYNEYDTIIFDDYKIYSVSNNEESIVAEDDEIEWLLEEEPDIYSNNHPWDARTNFYEYITENQFHRDDKIYIPSRYIPSRCMNIGLQGYHEIICKHDRYDPVCYF